MKGRSLCINIVLCAMLVVGLIGCSKQVRHSTFVSESIKAIDVPKIKYRLLKADATGESSGFRLIWIPFLSPTESGAKLDMLNQLRAEGIETAGKNIAFMNATADREMRGLLGLIGFPAVVLKADVIEVLERTDIPSTSPTADQ